MSKPNADDLDVVDMIFWDIIDMPPGMEEKIRRLAAASIAKYREQLTKEIVICAALRLPDGRIIRGHRHGDCLRTAVALVEWQNKPESGVHGPPWDVSMSHDQGFITSRNRYVDRKEALRLQLAAGIPSACNDYRKSELFSEDLY